jgi:ubiquinone/menaquinone biosynthesis C-methylase UbiE
MERLNGAAELIDGPLDAGTLAGNLRDLERVNRWLGGVHLSWRAVMPYLRAVRDGSRPLTMLDVGTGAADIPRGLLQRAERRRLGLEILATDVRLEIVDHARRHTPTLAGLELRLVAAGALDAADSSFDIVHSSMVLHHLEPDQATAMLRDMARVARRAVVVNDLERGAIWWLGARLLAIVATRNRYTRHDGPLSVRRAYSSAELTAMAARAGLSRRARLHSLPGYRYALVFEHG